jgi:hypothetical protein
MKSVYVSHFVSRFFLLAVILFFFQTNYAQSSLPDTSKTAYNGISNSLKLYVFPAKGQSQQKQKEDEFECYKWAIQQSGIDPMNLPKVTADSAKNTGRSGGAVSGAAKGAAAGAAIGAIAGDTGEGAAIGAVGGALAGRKKKKAAEAQAEKQSEANVKNKEAEIKNTYIKAFSACIEGKGYTIK